MSDQKMVYPMRRLLLPLLRELRETMLQRDNLHATVDAEKLLQQLPMDFVVEAQKLLGISLEGSVG